MGYYNGNGVVSGGGESTRTLKTFYEWGGFAIRQKSVVETTVHRGVSKARAKEFHASDSLSMIIGGSGNLAWGIFDAEGDKTTVSYSQIADSNLYEVNVTTEHLNALQSSTNSRRVN